MLAARDAQRLEQVAAECRARGGKAIAVPTDVAREDQCQRLVERTYEEYARVDMLLNNAGFAVGAKFDELPDLRLFEQVMHVNFMGAVYCTYHALPHLKATKGRIVNISSLGGKVAIPGNTSYVASKFAMNGFSDSLRMELAATGVSVTVICPYWVVTEFHERFLNKDGKPAGATGRAIYTKRMLTAEQFAPIVVKAAARRQRLVVMSPGAAAEWLQLIAPSLLDRIIIQSVMRPMIRRMEKARLEN